MDERGGLCTAVFATKVGTFKSYRRIGRLHQLSVKLTSASKD